ncbi:MAG: DNA-protecting protein DprA, partial [Gammaproteobacteria bacterium]|nr:DNA-protecting protein DprA [Gammaproteobacteria bacterium]
MNCRHSKLVTPSSKEYTHLKKDAVQRDLAWLEHENHHLLTIQDPAYPTLLKQISDPPCVLYLLGKPELAI